MNRGVMMAGIIAGAILLAAGAMIYFSPYQTCVRDVIGLKTGDTNYVNGVGQAVRYTQQGAEIACATRH